MSNPHNAHKNDLHNKSKKSKAKPVMRNTRPDGFNDTESMAKDLLNAKGINYYEWLDDLHKKVILQEVTENKDKIIGLFMHE